MAEIAERLRIGRVREFPIFPLFLRDNKNRDNKNTMRMR